MKNDVYLKNTKKNYNNDDIFNPSLFYKEGLNIDIKSDKDIYDSVRNLFIQMSLDKENINTNKWNPFKDFIKEKDQVLIKPNLVLHINRAIDGTTDSLITNFSIIRPIIDYTIMALNGSGKIIVGDAPVQNCNFEEVIKINGLKDAIEKYNELGYNIELVDLRKNDNKNIECKIVSVDQNSSFCDVDAYCKKYAITNYNLKEMHAHHFKNKHEYCIPQIVLDSDVIINIPKPKCHRKAGITACMKNFIGVNGKKEYIPHHRSGSICNHGDEYPEKSLIKYIASFISNYSYKKNKVINFFCRGIYFYQHLIRKTRFLEGSWYGNDTIWRSILDINKIVNYADKNGVLTNKKQRVIFNIADMVISGEKEGPLVPSDKKVGLIIASFNSLNMDYAICKIMGFNPDKIKYINNGYALEKFIISEKNIFKLFDEKGEIDYNKYNNNFIPTDGWIDYLKEN